MTYYATSVYVSSEFLEQRANFDLRFNMSNVKTLTFPRLLASFIYLAVIVGCEVSIFFPIIQSVLCYPICREVVSLSRNSGYHGDVSQINLQKLHFVIVLGYPASPIISWWRKHTAGRSQYFRYLLVLTLVIYLDRGEGNSGPGDFAR